MRAGNRGLTLVAHRLDLGVLEQDLEVLDREAGSGAIVVSDWLHILLGRFAHLETPIDLTLPSFLSSSI